MKLARKMGFRTLTEKMLRYDRYACNDLFAYGLGELWKAE